MAQASTISATDPNRSRRRDAVWLAVTDIIRSAKAGRPGPLAALGVAAFVVLFGLEVLTEDEPLTLFDVLGDALQIALLVATAVVAGALASRVNTQQEERFELIRELDQARADGERWRREAHTYVAGLGTAIDQQFTSWGLSPAEREIGLLMLKGFSHKEIAALRGTSDATVRQQAKAVYQKAGVPGRTAFCSYFLEDLLPPEGLRAAVPADVSTPGVPSLPQPSER
jgi:DNA-binding CsgD family transcriptional regulator